jgi:hypothetical protein
MPDEDHPIGPGLEIDLPEFSPPEFSVLLFPDHYAGYLMDPAKT